GTRVAAGAAAVSRGYFSAMTRVAARLATIGLALSVPACASPHRSAESAAQPSEHSLAGLAAQHVAVLPTYAVRVMPELNWASSVGRLSDLKRTMDADILAAFDERGLKAGWVFPESLEQSYRHNPTYATDPYALAEEPLRAPSLLPDARLPEPLASQVRTLVALHDDVRLVLAPVELRFEKAGTGGRGVLRLVLLDARTSTIRWSGDVSSDPVDAFTPAITASLGARMAAMVAPQ
ncbi:MAG TPA: hypothetical protein VN600_06940, partial [Gemmatimonadaceae bacterium]|nr:hypothetical protein [Gemmatimonadaceae bacterium]